MKKINIFTFIMALIVLVGCDYNDDNFSGYDSAKITDTPNYIGVFAGAYPEDGYFTDRTTMVDAINTMLKDTFKYVDKAATANISVLFGDITPGFSTSDVSYSLTKADYDSMGEENGQPGKYDNFDGNMDVDGYLIELITEKYASLAQGKVVSVSYLFYESGATSVRTNSYKKEVSGWYRTVLNAFTADIKANLLDTLDYVAMGTEKGEPGKYINFDANMDIDHYVGVWLGKEYPYEFENTTAEVYYLFYASKTDTISSYYKFDGIRWNGYDPYVDVVDVTSKIAEMEFDGSNWKLVRLLGGAYKYTMSEADYGKLVDWVKVNKPAYMSTTNDYDDYYFGASAKYFNINNNYNTWKSYYNVNGEYDGYSDEKMQEVMDKRIAEGIATLLLPEAISNPDPGLSYQVTYNVYQGRGTGNYMQAFMYNESEGKYELVSTIPVKQ